MMLVALILVSQPKVVLTPILLNVTMKIIVLLIDVTVRKVVFTMILPVTISAPVPLTLADLLKDAFILL
jgi:hypothetical protein